MRWWEAHPEVFQKERYAVARLLNSEHAYFSVDRKMDRMVLTFVLNVAGCSMKFYSIYPDQYPLPDNGVTYGGLFTVPAIKTSGLLRLAADAGWKEFANLNYGPYDRHIILDADGSTNLCLGPGSDQKKIYAMPLYPTYTTDPNMSRSMTGPEAIRYTIKWWTAFVACLHDVYPYKARARFGAGPF